MGALSWDTFAGGTSAAEGKQSYQAKTSIGTYSINPLSSPYGRHRGYGLVFNPSMDRYRPDMPLYSRVDKDGNLQPFNGWVPEFRSPQAAKAAARKHYESTAYNLRRE